MSPLVIVGILALACTTSADVKHVLEGSASPPQPNSISPHAVNDLSSNTPNGPYWWMSSNSPLKAAYDYYKKCSTKGNCLASPNPEAPPPQPFRPHDTLHLDVKSNPFLNGNFNPSGGNANYNDKIQNVDFSGNPFLSGKVVTAGNGEPVVKDEGGFLGVQPAQPFANKKPGFATTHPLEQKNKKPGFATSHPVDHKKKAEFTKSFLNVTVECKGAGFICIEKSLCLNGVVNKNGEGLLQVRSDVRYCHEDTEVCCQMKDKTDKSTAVIKFAGGVGFSPGLIHVQPLNVQPEVVFAGEHGHHSSSTSKSIRDTSLSPNSVFSSTVDYSDTKFDSDVRFASTFQGPAYLPPIGPTTSPSKPFETRQPTINQQYVPSRPSTPQYVPPVSTTSRPTEFTFKPTYKPAPTVTSRPAQPTVSFPARFPSTATTDNREYLPPRSSTPSPGSTVNQYVTPQKPYQPSVTPQQPYQPSVTPQRPYQPSVTPQQPYQPSVTPQKPYQPSVTPQRPYQPTVTTQRPYQPSITPQKPYQPSVTPQKPYQPSVTTQRPYQPSITPQQPYQPSVTPQKPYQPSVTPQKPYQPSVTPQQPYQPSVTPQRPYQPSVTTQRPYQPSVTTQRPYQPSITPQKPYQPSVTPQKPYQPSVTPQQPYQPSITPQRPYQPSVTTQRPYQPSITPQQPYQPSVTPQKPYQPSVTPQQPYQPSVTPQRPYQPSVTTQRPYQPSITPQKPYQPSVTPQKPYQPSVTPQQPYQPSVTPQRPYQPSVTPSRPTTSREYLPPRVSQPSSPLPNPFNTIPTTSRPQPRPTPGPQFPSRSDTQSSFAPTPRPSDFGSTFIQSRPTPPQFRPTPPAVQFSTSRPSAPSSVYIPQPTPPQRPEISTPRPQYSTSFVQPSTPSRINVRPSTPKPFVPTTPSPSVVHGYEYPQPTPTFGYPSTSPRQDFGNSNVNNQYVPPPKKPGENPDQSGEAANVDGAFVRPTTPRTQFQGELNTAPPPGCAAALKCVQEIYCTAEGVISPVPVVLTKEQELIRVPTTVCQDTESGIIGKCCRDPNYKDPWPSANLVDGVDDGQYKEDDSIGQYQQDLQRNIRSHKGGPRQDFSNNTNQLIPQPTCGERHRDTSPKGKRPLDANFAEIPWQAMILRDSNRSLLCGGVIIRRDAVLTAAHCVEGLATSDILIKGGEWKLGIDEEPLPFQVISVAAVIRHPLYQKGSFINDLALLVLEEKLRFSKNVGPLCLPPPNQIPTENCIATGWGKRILQLHAKGAIMHAIDVKIMDNQQCQDTLANTFEHAVSNYSPNTLCGYSDIDQCKVDYGSALACSDGNQYTLSGIYSWDTGCKQQGQIGGYIAPDVEWIQSTLARPLSELRN